MVRNIVGPPARESDFFNREELISLIWDRLQACNILLAAPRRFGKTSIMYRLLDKPKHGWKPVHVDAESIREPVNFIIAILDALMADHKIREFLASSWKKAGHWTKQFFPDVELKTPLGVDFKIKNQIKAEHRHRLEKSRRGTFAYLTLLR